MEYRIDKTPIEEQSCGCLVLGFFRNNVLPPSSAAVDKACGGMLSRVLKRERLKGKAGDSVLLHHVPDLPSERVLLVGLGDAEPAAPADYTKALGTAIGVLKSLGAEEAVCALAAIAVDGRDLEWKACQTAELFDDGVYQFTQLKSEKEDSPVLARVRLYLPAAEDAKAAEAGALQGKVIAEGMSLAKDLGNLPGNVCTPGYLAERANDLGRRFKTLNVTVLEEAEMEELAMGALLSVSKGSTQPAKLIVIEYRGGGTSDKPVVLVGKGLTFDAGGISLKPAPDMDEMKYDMCGGASVLGVLSAVARLELPLNVVGLVPASENLPDGAANKPGDIVTSMSGQTIEILNTDAEGRLILCDALSYAKRYDPAVVIDIATLTGACVVALGKQASGLMGNDDALCDALLAAGERAGDRAWRLPLWEDYQEQLKSNFADMANVGGRDAGAVTAACFLSRFTKEYKWAHLDIAGTAWKTGKEKGATGRPVPLLCQYLLELGRA